MKPLVYSHIDYLILNAGVFALPYTKTVDGLETTFRSRTCRTSTSHCNWRRCLIIEHGLWFCHPNRTGKVEFQYFST